MSESSQHSGAEAPDPSERKDASGPASDSDKAPRRKSDSIGLRDIVEALVWALVVGLILKIFVLDIFSVPSGSMQPTLHIGDFVVVNKLAYSAGLPRTIPFTDADNPLDWRFSTFDVEHGDVVVFDFPAYGNEDAPLERYVKRAWGLPGDSIHFDGSRLTNLTTNLQINLPQLGGAFLTRAQRMHLAVPEGAPRGRLIVPYRGLTIQIDDRNIDAWKELIVSAGNRVNLSESKVYINGEYCDSYTFEHDYVFVVGDNRDNSYDSRYWGCVACDRILGKAVLVYWSRDDQGEIDFSRIGTIVE